MALVKVEKIGPSFDVIGSNFFAMASPIPENRETTALFAFPNTLTNGDAILLIASPTWVAFDSATSCIDVTTPLALSITTLNCLAASSPVSRKARMAPSLNTAKDSRSVLAISVALPAMAPAS